MAGMAVDTVVRHIRRLVRPPADHESTDGHLLERFTTLRDEGAFTELVQRHGRTVYNLCLRILGNVHEAEDAFQATFFVLVRKAGAIQKRDSVASWLFGVAYRIAMRAKRKAACSKPLDAEGADMAQADPETEAAWRELAPLLDSELERLPEKYKAPLVLCYFQGKSNEEAARLLRWPSGTVKGRLARARDLLRERLSRRGLVLTSGIVPLVLSQQAMAAPVPPHLLDSTVQAALHFAAGSAASVVSAHAAALSQGELQTMFATKLQIITALALLTGAGAYVTLAGHQVWADKTDAAAAPAAASTDNDAAKPGSFDGRWTAKIEIGDKSLLVRMDFRTEANQLKGTVRLSKDKMFELQKLKVTGSKISFDVDAEEADLSFKGELKEQTVSGTVEALTKKDGITEGTWTMSRR